MFLKSLDLLYLTISMTTLQTSSETSDAEVILNKYIDAIGGRAAIENANTRISTTTTYIPKKKKEIKTTMFVKKPDKAYLVAEFKLLGKTIRSEGGRKGEVVWQIKQGAFRSKYRIFSDKEKELQFSDLSFDAAAVSWKKFYKRINLAGEENIDVAPCYKVTFTPLDPQYDDTICFFEKETFLIKKIIKNTSIKDKSGPAEIYLSDYKDVDGLLIPHTIRRISKGEDDIVITIDKIESNIDIPDAKFELPHKIKALVKKQG